MDAPAKIIFPERKHSASEQVPQSGSGPRRARAGALVRREERVDELAKLTAGEDASEDDRFGHSVAAGGGSRGPPATVVVGAHFDDDHGHDSGSAYVFLGSRADRAAFEHSAKLTAEGDAAALDRFGDAVAVSADGIVVGAPFADRGGLRESGTAYLFRSEDNGTTWARAAELLASDAASADRFGSAVALSEAGFAVVGAYYRTEAGKRAAGAAYVFRVAEGEAVEQTAKLAAADGREADQFGHSLAASGETVVVGAPDTDDAGENSGAAYVFRTRDGGRSFTQTAKLLASDAGAQDRFGWAVAADGDCVVVGAQWNDDHGERSGSAYVFRTADGGDTFSQTAKLTARDAAAGATFGSAVAAAGEYVYVGATGRHGDAGAVYVYRTLDDGRSYHQVATLTASDAEQEDVFGTALAAAGDAVFIGAENKRHAGSTAAGSAYIFYATGIQRSSKDKKDSTNTTLAALLILLLCLIVMGAAAAFYFSYRKQKAGQHHAAATAEEEMPVVELM